jgi:FlaA1/EpsC-like NDP-sugar epimerase
MILLGFAVTWAAGIVFVVNLFAVWVPRTVPAAAAFGMLVVVAWGRAGLRRLGELDAELAASEGTNVLIVGAGEAGRELLASMFRDRGRTWNPVGFLDDDPAKRHLRLRHVAVVGTTYQMAERARELSVDTVVIALPSASSEVINRLRLAAHAADLKVKVLPATTQLLHEQVGIRDLRDINLSDVLGRNQLDTDVESVADYLEGRRVLVTGAGGSIGSELCRQIQRYHPRQLLMLDRDESALHSLLLSLDGAARMDSPDLILCDIRDRHALVAEFKRHRPDVVFHAAALKHLAMLEQYPAEAVKTNIVGTANVLEAAEQVGVSRFINISTDKAANPTSVLGYSKRIAERITARRAAATGAVFVSVRFGNVLGSRGSVLAAFAEQIARGGPVTVTDPDVTRYLMTVEEACQLVIQAAAIGSPGEALVLDMGRPIRILDVAHQLIEQSGTPVRIEFTGLLSGEKLHEDLFGSDERERPRIHPLISHVPVPWIDEEDVRLLPTREDAERLRTALRELCGEPGDAGEPQTEHDRLDITGA